MLMLSSAWYIHLLIQIQVKMTDCSLDTCWKLTRRKHAHLNAGIYMNVTIKATTGERAPRNIINNFMYLLLYLVFIFILNKCIYLNGMNTVNYRFMQIILFKVLEIWEYLYILGLSSCTSTTVNFQFHQ